MTRNRAVAFALICAILCACTAASPAGEGPGAAGNPEAPAAAAPLSVLVQAPEHVLAGLDLNSAGFILRPAATDSMPDIVVSGAPSAAARPVVRRYWAPFAGFWNSAEGIRIEDLRSLAAGTSLDWALLGADPGPVRLYLPEEMRPSVDVLLGPLSEGATFVPLAGIEAALAVDPLGLAVLPAEAARPSLRSLAVDGVDIVRSGDAAAYGLVERYWLEAKTSRGRAALAALAAALTAPAPVAIRIVFTGDIIPARCVYARHRALDDYRHAFAATAAYLGAADIAVGSLDASISAAGEPAACRQTLNLLAPPRSVEGLTYAGLDVISVATNHARDCGGDGLASCDTAILDTLANLRAGGIVPTGGGANLEEAARPAVLTVKGVRFAFLAYDDIAATYYGATATRPGTSPLDASTLAADVAAARGDADVVVVLPHWGAEYTADPGERQRRLGNLALDAGANLVVGNHPHWVQAVDWRGDAFLAYALGNFVFDQDWSVETQQGMVLEATFHGARLASVRLLAVRIVDMHQPVWASPAESRRILERVRAASAALP